MDLKKGILVLLGLLGVVIGVDLACEKSHKKVVRGDLKSKEDIVAIFPKTVAEIEASVEHIKAQTKKIVDEIVAIPAEKRTFLNTVKALDNVAVLSELNIFATAIQILEMVHSDKAMRDAAHAATQKLDEFLVDTINYNVDIYRAIKEYAEGNALKESLTEQENYYVSESMKDFIRLGLNLPEETRKEVRRIQKELSKLSQDFDCNIAADNRTITVPLEGLKGLDQDCIDAFSKTDDGQYVLGMDYPTYYNVLENCSVEDTRKQLYLAFNNRAYPVNDGILKQVIAKRDELAHMLGFKDYAHYNLDNSMVGTPERAHQFLDELLRRAKTKVQQEFVDKTKELPEGVTLMADGKMKPWDVAYINAQYKKKHFDVDEQKIAEYFPMEKTVQELLDIYRQFLGINFKEVPISGLWHPDIKLIEVTDVENGERLGYLLLDLYPRENKYSHACEIGIIQSTYNDRGEKTVALALVIANFPKSTATKPSLLKRNDVTTFFHEFGHAIHELLGRTKVASFSGTKVKRDFVEMPSQMLEEWLQNKEILKKVSGHYKTGEPLSDELIEKIQQLKHLSSGDWVQRQAYLAKLALGYFAPGVTKDPYALMKQLQGSIRTHIYNEPNDHMYASFGHLMGYGAQYYGYLWSKVFALDLFSEIEKQGLLNPIMGKKYVHDVIGQGGSKDPNILLHTFLGREPNSDAFFADLGI